MKYILAILLLFSSDNALHADVYDKITETVASPKIVAGAATLITMIAAYIWYDFICDNDSDSQSFKIYTDQECIDSHNHNYNYQRRNKNLIHAQENRRSSSHFFKEACCSGKVSNYTIIECDVAALTRKSYFFDRTEERIDRLFNQAKIHAPCLIVAHTAKSITFEQQEKLKNSLELKKEKKELSEQAPILIDELLVGKNIILNYQLLEFNNPKQKTQYIISQLHTKKFKSDCMLDTFEKMTLNLSLAQTITLFNFAEKISKNDNSDVITLEHFKQALKGYRPVKYTSGNWKTIYHELGHAIMAMHPYSTNRIVEISIIPCNVSGYEGYLKYRRESEANDIQVMEAFAGGIAEQLYENKIFSNVDEALDDFLSRPGVRSDLKNIREYLEFKYPNVDEHDLLQKFYQETYSYLKEYKQIFDVLAIKLFTKKIMSGTDIQAWIRYEKNKMQSNNKNSMSK